MLFLMSVYVETAVIFSAVLTAIDGLRVARRADIWVTQARVQLVNECRTHVDKVQQTDVLETTFHVEHVQQLNGG